MGCAIFGMPYSIVGVAVSAGSSESDEGEGEGSELLTLHSVSLYVYLCVLLFCLAGLKAMAHQLHRATRTFIVFAWVANLLLLALLLIDAHVLLSSLPQSPKVGLIMEICCELLAAFAGTMIARQATGFWGAYEAKSGYKMHDLCLTGTLAVLGGGLVVGLAGLLYVDLRRL
ncbi:hypothetical protein B484DRAFT_451381 [Ochromonadaceae sp. CCMP2298]|nr:hypothetical protein B484DRAFT_451381 [Ochromonadaceae sp. CCMP2298]